MLSPIETRYAGCRFRSRLEARWAVAFDAMGVRWNYEPEGFELVPLPDDHPGRLAWTVPEPGVPSPDDHAGCYLPDFHLEGIGWFEVKGTAPDPVQAARLDRFALLAGERLHVAVGTIPDPASLDVHGHPDPWVPADFDIDVRFDHHYAFCLCPSCGKVGIEFDGRGARVCRHDLDDKGYTGAHPLIRAAYTAAREARFARQAPVPP